jgi:general secretion pathway protein E
LGRKKKAAQKTSNISCPFCKKPVDLIDDYQTLKFDECPHCHGSIDPLFEPENYLQILIDHLVEATKKRRKKQLSDMAGSQAMAALLRAMYQIAVHRRATDIHIERDENGGEVRFRIDGMLADAMKLPAPVALAFLSSIKVQANLDITNHTTPQDGRYQMEVEGTELDIRISCSPSSQGEILFMRLLDKQRVLIKPAVLGFEGKNLEYFEEAIRKPHGLILVTGPTGSGKSTTLYVALHQINTGERNILTIEDPVEYQMEGLKQMQVNPDRNFSFATGLRSILRQDPDVIMVGEIRDSETANMAIDAAVTGHLVFSTLHTMDTASTISRLADLGVAPKRYASALEIIIAQRLVRLICPHCKQPHVPDDAQLERLDILKWKNSIKFMAGTGCQTCNFTGYYGRRAILEILKPDEDLRELMERDTSPQAIREAAQRSKKMRLLRQDGVLRIVAGQTTVEEVLRATEDVRRPRAAAGATSSSASATSGPAA